MNCLNCLVLQHIVHVELILTDCYMIETIKMIEFNSYYIHYMCRYRDNLLIIN